MGKIITSTYVSLDGVIEQPIWTQPYFNEEVGKFQNDLLFSSDALLLGRETYQGMSEAWPAMKDEDGFADRINGMPKFVATTTLEKAKWNASFIKENVVEEVIKLKQQPGDNLLIYGSSELVQSLMEHDLIDEYNLILNPVVVGKGKTLFRDGSAQKDLKLKASKITQTGVALLTYQPKNA